jgi:predicted porin
LSASYNLLYANENVAGSLFGTGKTRGHLTLAGLFYQFNKNTKALITLNILKRAIFITQTNWIMQLSFKTEITMKF